MKKQRNTLHASTALTRRSKRVRFCACELIGKLINTFPSRDFAGGGWIAMKRCHSAEWISNDLLTFNIPYSAKGTPFGKFNSAPANTH